MSTREIASKLVRQIEQSRTEVRRLKEVAPYIFPEWAAVKAAEEAVAQANDRLAEAKRRWDQLGA